MTVTCWHHFLTFHSHLHTYQSYSWPCSSIEIALVLAPKDLFLLIPEDVWLFCNILQQSLILNLFIPLASQQCTLFVVFWWASYLFGYAFSGSIKATFTLPMVINVTPQRFDLKEVWPSIPSVHVFLKWSLSPLMTSLLYICWWIPKLTSLLISDLDVCNKHLRGGGYLVSTHFFKEWSFLSICWSCVIVGPFPVTHFVQGWVFDPSLANKFVSWDILVWDLGKGQPLFEILYRSYASVSCKVPSILIDC